MRQLHSQVTVRAHAAAEGEENFGSDEKYQIPDQLRKRIQVLLPLPPPKKKNKDSPGRPRMDDSRAMNGIFYVLRTGCQWMALPRSLGAASTVHDRFQYWREAGVFERMWNEGVLEYDAKKGIDREWQSMDTATTKAPHGEKKHEPQPNRQGKVGDKAQHPS